MMQARFRSVAGVQTRYLEAGSGRPLVLLHGVGMPAEIWINNIDSLAREFHVYAPDLLGCGFTSIGGGYGESYHLATLNHLSSFIQELQMETVGVVGSSLGALFATLLHLRHPGHISRLVLVSSGSIFSDDQGLRATYDAAWSNGREAISDPTVDKCRTRMSAVLGSDVTIPETLIRSQMQAYSRPDALSLFDERMRLLMDLPAWRDWRVLDKLEQITAGTLAVFGERDPRANLPTAKLEYVRIPNCKMHVFEGARHYPNLEQPDRFNQLVLDFLCQGTGHSTCP